MNTHSIVSKTKLINPVSVPIERGERARALAIWCDVFVVGCRCLDTDELRAVAQAAALAFDVAVARRRERRAA